MKNFKFQTSSFSSFFRMVPGIQVAILGAANVGKSSLIHAVRGHQGAVPPKTS